jgi:molybdopterin-containing oxidoreductase family membrane subunit
MASIGPGMELVEILLALFMFSMIVLAMWQGLRRPEGNWQAWLRASIAIGMCGGLLGAVVHSITLIEQYAASGGDEYERYALVNGWTGPYWWSFWGRPLSLLCLSILLFIARKLRSWWIAWSMALLLSVPLGLLFMAITSLHRDHLPSEWSMFHYGWSAMILPFLLLFSAALMLWAQPRRFKEGDMSEVRSNASNH